MITTVAVAGVDLDPGAVLADVTVLHGRQQAGGPAVASSATVVVELPPGPMPATSVGDTLTLHGDSGPMFTGRITDLALTHRVKPSGELVGVLAITGMGPAAALGMRSVGDQPWPAEPGTDRAARILDLAGVPYVIDGAADATVLPRDVDSRPALQLLDDLAASTAAAVVDLPTGQVLYQPMAERARPVKPFRWQDFPPDFKWANFAPGFTWKDFDQWHSSDSEFPLPIPGHAVEWEPTWQMSEASVLNHVRVGYGPTPSGGQQPWTELVDQASIDRHGRRYQYVGTELQDLADAQAYASWVLAVNASPHWRYADIAVALGRLDPGTRAEVLALTCGRHITVDGLPGPTPALVAEGIVEGWTYNMWAPFPGALAERIVLHVSALRDSLAVMTWADFPPAYTWADFPTWLTWADLTSPDVLTGA